MTDGQSAIILDRALVVSMMRALAQDEARRAGVAEGDIERHLFFRYRVEQAGGAQVVIYGLGRIRAATEEGA